MCNQTTYQLPCEHLRTQVHHCPSAPKTSKGRKVCKNVTYSEIAYPPPAGFDMRSFPKCPLASCPYEARNRCWNCCWCGKGWNDGARCSCVMIIEGNEYRCEHMCCNTCTAAGY
ncbi:hypothetical protein F5X68DRAFT_194406 [Plectosphaerella plurivora]|uniref:Uncharacterized protein n=1 Tax=Plectosphaerella plurivora TaxID=936078 RepID=A0A9P8V3G8_9PEZI|nr:hypothetical protein F5X68DRAFT_194406 [Plectosphaerella plurivora]